ncbi:large-conductance mechanosensitive channel [Alkalibacillus almallahensis]|nr:large-conductance mechanosensitive channel [Alkalibacillus almallahensis]
MSFLDYTEKSIIIALILAPISLISNIYRLVNTPYPLFSFENISIVINFIMIIIIIMIFIKIKKTQNQRENQEDLVKS